MDEPSQPTTSGVLEVGDGQRLAFRVQGPAWGRPVVVLHGGPGSGATPPVSVRLFDRDRDRVVLFDQLLDDGWVITSTTPDFVNPAVGLCHEVGVICEAHKLGHRIQATACVLRLPG